MWPRSFCQLLSTFFFLNAPDTFISAVCDWSECACGLIYECAKRKEDSGSMTNRKSIINETQTHAHTHAKNKKIVRKKNNKIMNYLSIYLSGLALLYVLVSQSTHSAANHSSVFLRYVALCGWCQHFHKSLECIWMHWTFSIFSTFKIFDSLISKFLLLLLLFLFVGFSLWICY